MIQLRARRNPDGSGTRQRPRAASGRAQRSPSPADEILRLQRLAGNRAVSLGVQRTIGDGHDLASPRFSGDAVLEGVFDNERLLRRGSTGKAVEKVQQALVDYGFRLPKFGVDGKFGRETEAAVKGFQADAGLSGADLDGVVGPVTMGALDRRGVTYAGPGSTVGPAGAAPAAGPGGVQVTMPPRIRAASTPETMAQDRIPPRVDTPVGVSVSGLAPGASVTLSVAGASAANGTVTIDGAATKNIAGPTVVQLQGATQTGAGNGGKLQLVARQGATEIARSGGFSVSAIPQFYTDAFVSDVTGTDRGIVVQDGWESDSGVFADLDQADISEEVEDTVATGCFAGIVGGVSHYLAANALTQDTHGTQVTRLVSPGRNVTQQTCKFRDKRSGANDIPMRDSGFEIVRNCFWSGGVLRIRTTKVGKATTAHGVPSGAGDADVRRPSQVV